MANGLLDSLRGRERQFHERVADIDQKVIGRSFRGRVHA
jgi:hypothetical protein